MIGQTDFGHLGRDQACQSVGKILAVKHKVSRNESFVSFVTYPAAQSAPAASSRTRSGTPGSGIWRLKYFWFNLISDSVNFLLMRMAKMLTTRGLTDLMSEM